MDCELQIIESDDDNESIESNISSLSSENSIIMMDEMDEMDEKKPNNKFNHIESDDEDDDASENDQSVESNDIIIMMDEMDVKDVNEPTPQMVIPKKKFIQIERIDIEEEEIRIMDTCSNCKINHELLILVQNLTLKINAIAI